ncbi:unnamed protein product [Urochloa decumbens]|uniref:F-box domain-containing protein n=1 Tax=Urochloa decumbens TaxID=240449 RepID=A0ABC9F3Q5_9POAL
MADGAAAAMRAVGGGRSAPDRLSALSDDLLRHVLSFLPAEMVVQTTVLSKRWVDLWRSVPGINLDLGHFRRGATERWIASWERMENFTNNLLIQHNAPCLDAFRFHATCANPEPLRHVDRWVRRAIKDNPLVLELSVPGLLPPDAYRFPYLASSPCRRLKRLQLRGVTLDHSFAGRLHSWWPDLEDLVLEVCDIDQAADVFVVRVPALTSLCLHIPFDTYKNGVSLDGGSFLMQASIQVVPAEFSPKSETIILRSLFNVTNLELTGFQERAVLNKEFNNAPVFGNLRTLSLASCFSTFKALRRFMQKSPNLEKLILKDFKVVPIVEPAEYPTLENLRTLILDKCSLHDNFWLLNQWLQNSPNLEKLSVCNCKLPDGSTGGANKTNSRSSSLVQCPKLKCTEITHDGNHANIPELVKFLLDIAAPENTITVKKI